MGDKVRKLKGRFVSVAQILLDGAGYILGVMPDIAKPTLRNLLHAQFKKSIIEAMVKLIFLRDCRLYGYF